MHTIRTTSTHAHLLSDLPRRNAHHAERPPPLLTLHGDLPVLLLRRGGRPRQRAGPQGPGARRLMKGGEAGPPAGERRVR